MRSGPDGGVFHELVEDHAAVQSAGGHSHRLLRYFRRVTCPQLVNQRPVGRPPVARDPSLPSQRSVMRERPSGLAGSSVSAPPARSRGRGTARYRRRSTSSDKVSSQITPSGRSSAYRCPGARLASARRARKSRRSSSSSARRRRRRRFGRSHRRAAQRAHARIACDTSSATLVGRTTVAGGTSRTSRRNRSGPGGNGSRPRWFTQIITRSRGRKRATGLVSPRPSGEARKSATRRSCAGAGQRSAAVWVLPGGSARDLGAAAASASARCPARPTSPHQPWKSPDCRSDHGAGPCRRKAPGSAVLRLAAPAARGPSSGLCFLGSPDEDATPSRLCSPGSWPPQDRGSVPRWRRSKSPRTSYGTGLAKPWMVSE